MDLNIDAMPPCDADCVGLEITFLCATWQWPKWAYPFLGFVTLGGICDCESQGFIVVWMKQE